MTLNFKILVLIGAASLLPACIKKHEIKKIEPLTAKTAQYQQTKKDVTIYSKYLDNDETYEYFGLSKFYSAQGKLVALQITITNQSNISYCLNAKSFTLPIMSLSEIMQYNRKSMFWSAITGLGIGILLAPIIVGGCIIATSLVVAYLIGPISFTTGLAIALRTLFFGAIGLGAIPLGASAVAMIDCAKDNGILSKNQNMLSQGSILPYEIAHGVIFILQKDLENKHLDITLFDEANNPLKFEHMFS